MDLSSEAWAITRRQGGLSCSRHVLSSSPRVTANSGTAHHDGIAISSPFRTGAIQGQGANLCNALIAAAARKVDVGSPSRRPTSSPRRKERYVLMRLVHLTWGPTFPAEPRLVAGPNGCRFGRGVDGGQQVAGCNPAVKAAGVPREPSPSGCR
jgi:hypothetical protein